MTEMQAWALYRDQQRDRELAEQAQLERARERQRARDAELNAQLADNQIGWRRRFWTDRAWW